MNENHSRRVRLLDWRPLLSPCPRGISFQDSQEIERRASPPRRTGGAGGGRRCPIADPTMTPYEERQELWRAATALREQMHAVNDLLSRLANAAESLLLTAVEETTEGKTVVRVRYNAPKEEPAQTPTTRKRGRPRKIQP